MQQPPCVPRRLVNIHEWLQPIALPSLAFPLNPDLRQEPASNPMEIIQEGSELLSPIV
ncbi:hypothetical protein PtB15_4B152 [Puccinia triticina]|nr:hypothetical protein PtB15_4B152 [Puccinia triticina]